MSRICALTPQLQVLETSSEVGVQSSSWDRTTRPASRRRSPWWSVRESRRTLMCSARSDIGVSVGYRSLNSPFGSCAVH
jgi:hypothetical protein